ncbi:MAG: DUF2148 domain-containing protein [bacterium]
MNALSMVAELMALSARTAPKGVGQDFLEIRILNEEEIARLADRMVQYAEESGNKGFARDGENVRNSGAVLLLGLKDAKPAGLNCGACGLDSCSALMPVEKKEFKGPQCALRILDLGIALGSAVKTASLLNADNRIMYRIGVAARMLGLAESDFVMGIPLSASGKSIYFDRKN